MKRLKATPITMIILRDVNNLEHDADTQYRFNRYAAIFWLINMPTVVILSLIFPHIWLQISVMYLIQASLWALVATHFGAMSAALAAANSTDTAKSINDIHSNVEDNHRALTILHPELVNETA